MAEIAVRSRTTIHGLYTWIKRYDSQQSKTKELNDLSAELVKCKINNYLDISSYYICTFFSALGVNETTKSIGMLFNK
jgi:predicted transcriptional regulator